MENNEILKRGIEAFNIEADESLLERFKIYKEMLIEWNQKINLTTITDEKEIIIKHFLDSVSCVECGIDFKEKKVIDVGTGAGFPGVPLLIAMPNIKLTLLDSLKKRTIFLSNLIEKLGLQCNIIHGRAEDYGKKSGYRESFGVVLSRAVANMAVLSEYTLPFVEVGGVLICQKGPGVFDEIENGRRAIEVLGGKVENILSTEVYMSDFTHYLAVVKKIKVCPGKYPRKAGIVEKNPIK